jgi:DNA-binding LacI/PurR family transcriptional regulator
VRPTLKTVADAVGVSRSTVSNAYSRPDQLSAELRERILATAEKLGYCGPDPTARGLRRGRVGAVGVLFTASLSHAFADPYAVQFLRGLSEAAEEADAGLLLIPLPPDDAPAAIDAVSNAVVDGFCVYCVPDWHQSLATIKARGLPVVSTENRDGDPDALYAGIDEAAATRMAGTHLTRLGHTRFGLIADWVEDRRATAPTDLARPEDIPYYVSRERLCGYRDAFAAAGVPWSQVTTVGVATNRREEGAAAAAHLLDQARRPTAIATTSDVLALGVLDAMTARGLRPGRDVSVVGFDDIPEAATARLTTIRQPAADKGRLAGRLLLDPPAQPERRQVVLPTELIVRASTGPLP